MFVRIITFTLFALGGIHKLSGNCSCLALAGGGGGVDSLVPLGTRGFPRFRFLGLLLPSSWHSAKFTVLCQQETIGKKLPTRSHCTRPRWNLTLTLKIADSEPLHMPMMEFVDFVLSGSELAEIANLFKLAFFANLVPPTWKKELKT